MKTKNFTSVLSLLLINLFISLQSQAQCHIDDWTALKALYNSTDGDNWFFRYRWNSIIATRSSPPENCDLKYLEGVQLNDEGRVSDLILNRNSLEGNIPKQLIKLSKLANLDLSENQLSGSIPMEIGKLKNLKNLDLELNQLSGSIPIEIGDLSNLKWIRLYYNQLDGNIPAELGNLNNLETLDLSSNQLNGNIPIELGNLSNLEKLYLSSNQLDGNIPAELGNLNNLETLNISSNQLDGNIPVELGILKNLVTLNLSSNQLNGNIPVELGNLNNLFDLNLNSNELDGSIPSEIGNLSKLYRLHLEENRLIGNIPPELGNLSNLYGLYFNENQLNGSIPIELTNLDNLFELSLFKNQLSGSIPKEFRDFKSLKLLNLSNNLLSGSIPKEFGDLTCLKLLNLSNNLLSGSLPPELMNLISLDRLELFNNNLSGCLDINLSLLCRDTEVYLTPSNNFDATWEDFCNSSTGACPRDEIPNCHLIDWNALKGFYDSTNGNNWKNRDGWKTIIANQTNPPVNCNLGNLYGVELDDEGRVKELSFYSNGLSGSLPTEVGSLDKLELLRMYFNELSGNIPKELGNLSSLIELTLSYNQLSGSIPIELGKLNSLESLSLGNNQLSGSIPIELGNLNNLESLSLGNNQITGSIPLELGNLNNLESLSLGNNQLSGSLPPEIGKLSKLTFLYLYNNQLSGTIPSEFGNLSKLEGLYLDDNLLSGNIAKEIGNLINLNSLFLSNNQLDGNIPPELGSLINLSQLSLSNNKLSGNIPSELGNINFFPNYYYEEIAVFDLSSNQLSGCYPDNFYKYCYAFDMYVNTDGNNLAATWEDFCATEEGTCIVQNCHIDDWTALKALYESTDGDNWKDNTGWEQIGVETPPANCNLGEMFGVELNEDGRVNELCLSNNEITGDISTELGNLDNLQKLCIDSNRLNYTQIKNIVEMDIENIDFSPQFFNYSENYINVINLASLPVNLQLSVPFENDNETEYEWFKNGEVIPDATDSILNLTIAKPEDAGIYTMNIAETNIPGLEFISDPVYVMIEGFDFYGEPIIENQLIIEFGNAADKKNLEESIFPEFGQWGSFVTDSCNCNRELYLYEFPSMEETLERWIELNQKTVVMRDDIDADGGFNYVLSLGEISEAEQGFNVLTNCEEACVDSLSIHIIDSGYKNEIEYNPNADTPKTETEDTTYIIPPKNEVCNGVDPDFKDLDWHGTYGTNAIINNFVSEAYLKVVPVKIFDENRRATLFDLICGLYYAIDENSDVINISGGYYAKESFSILDSALKIARDKELFIVTSAGNDSINIDNSNRHQYPAYYAKDYENVISVASINLNDHLSDFSNFSKQSVTLAAYGEDILSYVSGIPTFASGTSMATFFVSKELALEIGTNRNRTFDQKLKDFEEIRLVANKSLSNVTKTGKHLNVTLEGVGCTDPTACNYFMHATIDDGSCEYNLCSKCHLSDWDALKALYFDTGGNNWKNDNNWEILNQDFIPTNCNLEILHGVSLNEEGRVNMLNLYNINLIGKIPAEIEGLSELSILSLAANNLNGKIPNELTNLTNLSQLILTANNLSGSIPDSIGKLVNLKRLHLSGNQLIGEIPVEIGQLNQLEYLTLDNNQLEGSIPREIVQFDRLRQLNICYNQLSNCYDTALTQLCNIINVCISEGNSFAGDWGTFCLNGEGACQMRKIIKTGEQKMNVYPNPSQGKLFIEIVHNENENNLFSILNLEGKCLLKIDAKRLPNRLYEIDLSSLHNGMYIIEYKNSDNIYAQKIILN